MAVQVHLMTSNKGQYWTAWWRDSNGRKRFKGLGAVADVPKRVALRMCNDLVASIAVTPASRDARGNLTLEAWCTRYMEIRTDLSDGSRELAKQTIEKLQEHFGADARIGRISPAAATDFRLWLEKQPGRKSEKLSLHSVSLHLRNAKTILGAAVKEKQLDANPFANTIPAGYVPQIEEDWENITLAQFEKLIDACTSPAWRCLFALCRLAGTRSGSRGGEALALEWSDIDWHAKTMLVWDQKRKRQRIVPMSPRLHDILREAFEGSGGEALVCPVPTNNLQRDAAVIVKRAGLPAYSKPFHTLRKCLENEWLDQHPLPTVCKWLGNSPAVASKHYHKADTESAVARVTGEDPAAKIRALEAQLRELKQAVGPVSVAPGEWQP